MRINTQFPVAVHILALLAFFEDKSPSSELIAKSVGTNPVVIRRVVSQLKKSGLVDAQAGIKGTSLRKKPKDITLLDIYNAVRSSEEALFDVHPNPNPACVIGAHIKEAMSIPLSDAQKAMENKLASFTLLDIVRPISEKSGLSPN